MMESANEVFVGLLSSRGSLQRFALRLESFEQVSPGIIKRLRSLPLQIGTKPCQINSDSAEFREHLVAITAIAWNYAIHAAMFAERKQGFLGHRVDRIGSG